jgi:NAD(P)-dependent dehydrogenase (short-subunit alcohol dehydrogenase family)
MKDLSGRTTIVVGASRGLGRGIATAFAEAGAPVVAVSRTAAEFPDPANGAGTIQSEIADAADPTVAASLLDRYEPEAVILVAGATPHMRPLQHQTRDTFSVNRQADVRIAFHWPRDAPRKPLRPGSRVVVLSSGAAANPKTLLIVARVSRPDEASADAPGPRLGPPLRGRDRDLAGHDRHLTTDNTTGRQT